MAQVSVQVPINEIWLSEQNLNRDWLGSFFHIVKMGILDLAHRTKMTTARHLNFCYATRIVLVIFADKSP